MLEDQNGIILYLSDLWDVVLGKWETLQRSMPQVTFRRFLFGCEVVRQRFAAWLSLPPGPEPRSLFHVAGIKATAGSKKLYLLNWTTNRVYKYLRDSRPGPSQDHCKMVHEVTRGNNPSIKDSANFWKNVYQEFTNRKAADLWWLLIHKGLYIGNRIKHIPGVSENSFRCSTCFQALQSHEHLFVECRITRQAWETFLLFACSVFDITPPPTTQFTWVTVVSGFPEYGKLIKKRKKPWYCMLAAMFHAIWSARNLAIFHNARWSSNLIWFNFRMYFLQSLTAVIHTYKCYPHRQAVLRLQWGDSNTPVIVFSEEEKVAPNFDHVLDKLIGAACPM